MNSHQPHLSVLLCYGKAWLGQSPISLIPGVIFPATASICPPIYQAVPMGTELKLPDMKFQIFRFNLYLLDLGEP